jgi:hypothetical protein
LPFLLWNLRVFLFGYVEFLKKKSFLVVVLGFFKNNLWSVTRRERGHLHFFLWNVKVFYFDILKFRSCSIFILFFILGFFVLLCEISQGGKGGILCFYCELQGFFILVFWSSRVFQFSSCQFRDIKKNYVKFHKRGVGVFGFFWWMWKFFDFDMLKF